MRVRSRSSRRASCTFRRRLDSRHVENGTIRVSSFVRFERSTTNRERVDTRSGRNGSCVVTMYWLCSPLYMRERASSIWAIIGIRRGCTPVSGSSTATSAGGSTTAVNASEGEQAQRALRQQAGRHRHAAFVEPELHLTEIVHRDLDAFDPRYQLGQFSFDAAEELGFDLLRVLRNAASSSPAGPIRRTSFRGLAARIRSRGSK